MPARTRKPRIAMLGIGIESNRFAPVTTLQDFRNYAYCVGEEILASDVIAYWIGRPSGGGFVGRMTELTPWTPVPVLVADAQAGGPCDHADFVTMRNYITSTLWELLPVDGVYIVAHGAGTTMECDDLDGAYFRAVRDVVGDDVPIVATLDLHGNVSDEMAAAVDALIAQRTNPHVDSGDRAAEAAEMLNAMIRGASCRKALVRLPLVTPQVTQLSAPGNPYGDLVAFAHDHQPPGVTNVSLLPGFAFSDTRYNGFAIVVHAGTTRTAQQYAKLLAERAWSDRHRYRPALVGIEDAIVIASRHASTGRSGPLIFADVGDNPGGGGSGNTMWLIEAFYRAGIRDVLVGIVFDPALVAEAASHGKGARFRATFNRETSTAHSKPFTAQANVVTVCDGDYDSVYGVYKGSRVPLGRSCVLQLNGLLVVVTGIRQQLLGADCFEHFGIDCTRACCIVAKSRGHFRAGFAHLVRDDHIFEVDAPGLTTPNLANVEWKNLPRPVYPLDDDASWTSAV